MNRREFLHLASRLGLSSPLLYMVPNIMAEGTSLPIETLSLQLGVLKLGPDWNKRPRSLIRLIKEVRSRCNIPIRNHPVELRPREILTLPTPIMFLSGHSAFDMPDHETIQHLRWILDSGGCLFFDDQEGAENSAFYKSALELMARVFPETPSPFALPEDHTLYQSYYLLKQPRGRLSRAAFLEGWQRGTVTPAIFSHNDLLGALEADVQGNWRYNLEIGGGFRRELCFRLAINLIYYNLTLNYKKDRAFPPILKRRRRQ